MEKSKGAAAAGLGSDIPFVRKIEKTDTGIGIRIRQLLEPNEVAVVPGQIHGAVGG